PPPPPPPAPPPGAARRGPMEYVSYDLASTGQTGAQMQVPVVRLNGDLSVSVPAAAVGDSVDPAQIVLFVAACVWLLGLCVLLLWNLLSLLRFRGRLRGAEHLRENIYRLSDGGTPFVYGLLRPRIYLPLGLGAEEERYMLLHEQIHIRRGDPVFRFLACAALCLHWFNPLVWLAFALSGKDMEMSCDEAVLRKLGGGVKKEYSASLLALATGERALRSIPVAFGESSTKSRIKNVLSYQKAKPVIVAVAAVICVLAFVFLAANPSGGEKSGGTNEAMYGETVANLGDDETGTDSADLSAYGVEYQAFTEDTLYPYLLEVAESEGVDLLETWYTQVDELTVDIGEGDGSEMIEIYTGDSGDGGSGIVLFKDADGEVLYAETAHSSRAGWNNIYLGSMDGTDFIMTLYIEDREVYGAYSYQVFRLGEDGQILQIAGSSFSFGSEYLYDDDIFHAWADDMSAYLSGCVLLLSSQDGELRTEQVSEADKYNYETLRRE
ncbi:MAG: M56 family metallopeptidase, partial [Lachnospiraceae bacterium]|nr:M56 family metallopeptidase [Lachnospiraceae bacterium]